MKSYAPIASLVTTADGTCPGGYIEVEHPVVNGGLQALVHLHKERADKAESLLKRVLNDENFGIGLSDDIREFLGSTSAASGDDNG